MPIRKAKPQDLDLMINIIETWDQEEENEFPTDVNKMIDYITDGGVLLYFNEEKEEPIGVMIFSDNSQYLNLSTLYVHPDYRSEGIGTKLLNKFVDILNTRCTEAFLEVDANNPAIDLYERFGFKEDSRYQVSTHRIVMTRPITPHDELSP